MQLRGTIEPVCMGTLWLTSAFLELGRQAVSDAVADVGTGCGSTDIVGQHLPFLEVVSDALVNEASNGNEVVVVVFTTEVIHHHLNGVEGGDGVDLVLSGVLWSGAMDGLEEGVVITDVTRCRHAHAALKNGAKVGGNIAEHVGGHDGVVVLG